MSTYDALDYFGRQLTDQVRDAAFSDADQVLDGKNQAPSRKDFLKKLARFSQDDVDCIRKLIRDEIDNTIHHLLWWLEREQLNEEQHVKLDVVIAGEVVENLAEKSDGLAGEYEGKEGWMGRFSKYPVRQ